MQLTSPTVAVVGLGYVGLPLVVEFGKHTCTNGFDNSTGNAASCLDGHDPSRVRDANFILVAVPTPVGIAHTPDFGRLFGAGRAITPNQKASAIVAAVAHKGSNRSASVTREHARRRRGVCRSQVGVRRVGAAAPAGAKGWRV